MSPDYYEVLGCKRDCSSKEIKSAYHRLILRFHPDRNSDPQAAEITARLNEAYSVLGDERKRDLYNAWVASSEPHKKETGGSTADSRPEISQVACAKCGCQNETIRLALLYYVISLVFITYKKGASGLWCQRCRIVETAKWTIVSGLLGWWAFPYGPIYTIQALFVNGRGGVQPRGQNAAVLRVLGYQLYQQGRSSEAFSALEESIRLEPNAEASELLIYLRSQQKSQGRSPVRKLADLAATAAPSLLVAALFSYGVYRVASAPSGYAVNYRAPQDMPAAEVGTSGSKPRTKANDLVSNLAGVVESRAPVVGTHYEGTTLVQDHELDRSKFDEAQLYGIAGSIGAELHSGVGDSDGFMASAYFNAELFALSVDIVKRFDQGRPISDQARSVVELGADPAVSVWLRRSRFVDNYDGLCRQLSTYARAYRPGKSTDDLSVEYHREDLQLDGLKERMRSLRSNGDVDSYNAMVSEYNAKVQHRNALMTQGKLQALASKKLDLSFNRCLDPGILMSKFQSVNLTSHAAEVDSLADPVPTQ